MSDQQVCVQASPQGEIGRGYSWAQPFIAQGMAWVDPLRHEYYECEIESLSGDQKLDLVARRGMTFPYPVTLLSSRRRYAFWRSWSHIGENRENLVMLRYVRSGAFALTQCGETATVSAGQFAFSKSSVPFRWESLVGDLSVAEYISVVLPLDLVQRHFIDGIPMKDGVSAPAGRRLAMATLLSLLVEQGEQLEWHVTEMLVETILKEAAETTRQSQVGVEVRKHIGDRRTEEILAYMSLHLSNPDLSVASVAKACGVSMRYLCHLLKAKGCSFSDVLWEERLEKTGQCLLALDSRHYLISEIAYMNGFKTATHFSRVFKNYWGCSPRKFRLTAGNSASRPVGRKTLMGTLTAQN